MSDYASLKVPDLKKLLSERSLPQSGNKADLIARLQEHDKSMTSPFHPLVASVAVDCTVLATIRGSRLRPRQAPLLLKPKDKTLTNPPS